MLYLDQKLCNCDIQAFTFAKQIILYATSCRGFAFDLGFGFFVLLFFILTSILITEDTTEIVFHCNNSENLIPCFSKNFAPFKIEILTNIKYITETISKQLLLNHYIKFHETL